MTPVREPLDPAPFLAWLDRRIARSVDADNPQRQALDAIGWAGESGERRLNRWRTEVTQVERAAVEDALHLAGVQLWEVYPDIDDGHQDDEPVYTGRKRGKPTGVHGLMTDGQVWAAHVLYDRQNLSLRALGKLLWQQFGYASAAACANSLSSAFIRLGLPRRERIQATVDASVKHGRARRKPYRDLDEYRKYRAEQRRASGEIRGVMCAGVREQYPRKGAPCAHHALADSAFCRVHDPRYREQVARDLEQARQQLGLTTTEQEAA